MTKISNSETKVKKGIEMNEKDYLNSLLTCLKDMEKNYVIAITEASSENLYQAHTETYLKLSDLGRDVYELMFQNGWYQLETAENSKIQEKINTLTQELNDIKN